MTTIASNTSVRERRRRSNPHTIEQMDILRAITAAEYSRRQFVLNFAASRDTKLLVPGKKADVIKQAEEWVAQWMNANGYGIITHDHFKYTVDERLWYDLVGADLAFPFSFMRAGTPGVVVSPESTIEEHPQEQGPFHEVTKADGMTTTTTTTRKRRPKSEAFLPDEISVPAMTTIEVRVVGDGQSQITTTTSNGNAATGDGKLSRQTTNTSTTTSNYTGTQLSSAAPTNSNNTTQSAAPSAQRPRKGSLLSGTMPGSGPTRKERKKSLSSATAPGPAAPQPNGTSGGGGSPGGDDNNGKKTKRNLPGVLSGPFLERRRSMSLTSLETDGDDLKTGRRASAAQEKFPFLMRWSRSWGRRTSA